MLSDFQQALADLVATPDLCRALRRDPAVLQGRYQLDEREARRLVSIVNDKGMAAACMVYRMNRITPLMINLPRTLPALAERLPDLLSQYWADHPRGHTHFYIESDRFCGWLAARLDEPPPASLGPEWAAIREALAASLTEAGAPTPDETDPPSTARAACA